MKKILCFSLACIVLLTTMFSINRSFVLAANEKSIGKNGKAFGALLKEASKKVADVKVVKFKYYYRPSPFVTNLYGVTSVHSVVLLDFNKYTAKMKSIVYYKDSNGNSNRAKVICKKDMQIDDCVFKFEDEIKNNAKLKKTLENVLSSMVFYLFDTSKYHNVGDFIFYPWQQGAYLHDAKYTKKKNGYQSDFTEWVEDGGQTYSIYLDNDNDFYRYRFAQKDETTKMCRRFFMFELQ